MDIVVYDERLSIVLGFITLIAVLAIFLSCRNFISLLGHLGIKDPTGNKAFRKFFKYHSSYWWGFGFVAILHLLAGIMHTSLVDPSDPDVYLHARVLIAGGSAFLMGLIVFTSCRTMTSLLSLTTGKNPLTGKTFRIIYRYHSYYWLVLLAVVIVHFTFSYLHTGIWAG
jgi:hypothetical protein